jgi:class 3 adenylate cyclase
MRAHQRAGKLQDMAEELRPEAPRPTTPIGPLAERVADADRDHSVVLLREHVVDGRLTLDEFSERVGLALQARTRGELELALADLPAVAAPQAEAGRRKARRWFVAVMSGSSAKGRWRVSGKTTAVAVMGGCDMDLRQAEIDGPEVVITAIAFWGGVNIVVPEGIDVELEGFSFMGGRNIRIRDVPIVPGSPRIRVRGFAVMGGIDVKSRGPRKGRELGQRIVDHVMGAVDAMPSLNVAPGAPIDLEALRRDIKAQFRAQRHGPKPQPKRREETGPSWREEDRPPSGPRDATPAPIPRPGEGTVTILFSDMVNYAGMTERLGDEMSRELLRDHHQIVRQLLGDHGGREVKVQGDGFMVAFGGVARALRCATAMQRAFYAYSDAHPERPIQVHIGVHTGEAMEEDDDFLGHTVIVASRLADVALPGEVLVSSLSAQLVERTGEFSFIDYREAALKGLTRPQQVATLLWSNPA